MQVNEGPQSRTKMEPVPLKYYIISYKNRKLPFFIYLPDWSGSWGIFSISRILELVPFLFVSGAS